MDKYVSECLRGANKRSWHAALSFAVKAEVVENSWRITLAPVCMCERERGGGGRKMETVEATKAHQTPESACRVQIYLGLVSGFVKKTKQKVRLSQLNGQQLNLSCI